ncbi:hypothetical protein [Nocardioides piscis]|uniref:Uncharacterized protein n=1 Tax=Nocardioides piscis TaxID=2714938 RepID=A0A6G7YK74_9ACTN|nr:hypothetical protein [Nocardioides piscis]QIK77137.1 hypothetical protein G7071_18570 [Nocardioides piscis]
MDADDNGERLAQWIEALGLTEQLGEAGLPSFVRDPGGRPQWSDPRTGEPLTREQLAELDRVLHQEGTEPAHAVPVALVKLRRLAQVRERLLASERLDYAAVAQRRGCSVNAARFALHKAAGAHEVLLVPHGEGVIVPAFQLTPDGDVRRDLLPVLRPLLAAGMDPWRAWGWLTEPVALLGGLVPAQVADDPEHADVVRRAALALAERSSEG